MDRCVVLLSETGDLKPLLLPALLSPGVAAAASKLGIPHPFPIVSRAWHEVEGALDAFFLAEGKILLEPTSKTNGVNDALKAYREFLYRCAEYVESVEKQMREIYADKKAFKAESWIDRQLSEECNALKHNGMRLGWSSAVGRLMAVNGYQLRHLVGDAEVEAMQFHKKSPSFSFGLRIRKMLAAAYLLSEDAGRKVIGDFGAAVVPEKPASSDAITKATKIGVIVFPNERSVKAPIFEFTASGDLKVEWTGGRTLPLPAPYSVSSVFGGDGFTRTFSYGKV